jgi:hypothetical protein
MIFSPGAFFRYLAWQDKAPDIANAGRVEETNSVLVMAFMLS